MTALPTMTALLTNAIFLVPWLLWMQPVDCIARVQSNLTAVSKAPLGTVNKEMLYTQNSLCRQNYCTNPIFPGINDLPKLELLQWQCSTSASVKQYMDFCKDAVLYDPALPSPKDKPTPVAELVKSQEDAAMTMFVYHLNGMGYEAWDYRDPSQSDNNCVRSVWKMVCFTYFPRADAGCQAGQQSFYKRPCKSSCQNYLQHCGVECCDESVRCVFDHTKTSATGQVSVLQTGYVDAEGPSAMCTGSARHSLSSPLFILLGILGFHCITLANGAPSKEEDTQRIGSKTRRHPRGLTNFFLVSFLGLLAFSLQGCEMSIPRHVVGNWRTKPNYLTEYAYIPPGGSKQSASLNSCNNASVPTTQQCSGKGFCRTFTMSSVAVQQSGSPPMAFCHCERDWADPECGTKRKSQMKAFFLSIFLGFLGADYFYLGFPLWGVGKLVTLGGCGFWWLLDIVRTGTGPVYAHNFRTSNDLPHWVAVLVMIFLCMLCGFIVAIQNFLLFRRKKRANILNILNAEEARDWNRNSVETLAGFEGPRYATNLKGLAGHKIDWQGRPEFSGYGSTLPVPHHNARAPYATDVPGNFGPAGIPGRGSPTRLGSGLSPLHIPYVGRDNKYVPERNATGAQR